MIKRILALFLTWKGLAFAGAFLAIYMLPLQISFVTDAEYKRTFPYFIWIWGNFDGFHYMNISKHGYTFYQHPFFPLYPALMYILFHSFHIYRLFGGQIISNLCFFISLFVLYKLVQLDKKSFFPLLGIIIILFPTSFYYGAIYNDSLFFLLATLSIYFARKRKFGWAGIVGALATLARLNGLALCFIILFEYLTSKNEKLEKTWDMSHLFKQVKRKLLSPKYFLKEKIYAILAIPAAFVSYLVYTQIFFNDWTLVFTGMKVWNQDHVTFPLQVVWRYLKIMSLFQFTNTVYIVAMLELFFVFFYVAMMIYGYKKIRFSYWLFFVISIIIPSLTGTFQGMPRYGLHIYPFFLTVALLLEHKSLVIKILYFVIAIILLLYCLTLFTRGYFVA